MYSNHNVLFFFSLRHNMYSSDKVIQHDSKRKNRMEVVDAIMWAIGETTGALVLILKWGIRKGYIKLCTHTHTHTHKHSRKNREKKCARPLWRDRKIDSTSILTALLADLSETNNSCVLLLSVFFCGTNALLTLFFDFFSSSTVLGYVQKRASQSL